MATKRHEATPHEGVKNKWIRRGKKVSTPEGPKLFPSLRQARRYWRTGKV